jgi:hypothetical protein
LSVVGPAEPHTVTGWLASCPYDWLCRFRKRGDGDGGYAGGAAAPRRRRRNHQSQAQAAAAASSAAGGVGDNDGVAPNPPRSTPDAAHINLLAPVAGASSPKPDQQAAPAPAPTGGGLAAPAAAIQGNALFQRMRAQAEAAQMAAEEAEQAEGQRRREAAEWEEVSGEHQPPRLEHVARGVCRMGADGDIIGSQDIIEAPGDSQAVLITRHRVAQTRRAICTITTYPRRRRAGIPRPAGSATTTTAGALCATDE